jgi:hypothetical protein
MGMGMSAQIGAWHHRQSGAPLLAGPKESGSGDGTRRPRPEGGAQSPSMNVAFSQYPTRVGIDFLETFTQTLYCSG